MYSKTFVTLNIGSTGVRLLSVEGRQVRKWGSIPLPPGLVKDGLILRPKVVGALISTLFKTVGVPKKQVIASLSGLSFIHRVLGLPKMEHSSLSEAIQRAARKEMMLPPEELYLRWQTIADRDSEKSFFVLGVPCRPIDVLVETLAEAGITPYLADLTPLALARTVCRDEAIIVNLEPDCFDIVLISGGLPAVMHTITPRGEGATPEDNTRRLSDELLKTIEFFNNSHPQNLMDAAAPVLVTGELSANALMAELIRAETGHPVSPVMPPLTLPPDFPAAAFAANIGLALKKLPLKSVTGGEAGHFRDINVNVLPDRYGAGASWLKPHHIVLSLVIVAGLGLLLPANQLRSQAVGETGRLLAEWVGISRELNQAQQVNNRTKQMEDTIKRLEDEAKTAQQKYQFISGIGGDFADNLKLVTGALPAGAYFTSVEIGDSQIIVEGRANSAFTVVDYVTALEALQKYAEVRIVAIGEGKAFGTGAPEISFDIVITK